MPRRTCAPKACGCSKTRTPEVKAVRFSLSGYREQDWMRNVPLYAISCKGLWRWNMDYEIRSIKQDEYPLLEDFLYEAIFVPEGFEGEVPRSVIYDDPKCRAAFEGFGALPDDRALVASVGGEVVGACWVRTTDEYGHIDGVTPSFSISLYKPHRGQGIGTAMMHVMLDELREAGYARASLSVQKENPALRLYERLGFRIVGDGADETEWLMVIDLSTGSMRTAGMASPTA